jgi:hypothetical protein
MSDRVENGCRQKKKNSVKQRLVEDVISGTVISETFPDMISCSQNDNDVPRTTVSFLE